MLEMRKYPIVVKLMSDGETKLYNLGKLKRLIDKSLAEDRFYQKPGYYFKPDWDEEQLSKREKSWL
jgi:hypothetical protein